MRLMSLSQKTKKKKRKREGFEEPERLDHDNILMVRLDFVNVNHLLVVQPDGMVQYVG